MGAQKTKSILRRMEKTAIVIARMELENDVYEQKRLRPTPHRVSVNSTDNNKR